MWVQKVVSKVSSEDSFLDLEKFLMASSRKERTFGFFTWIGCLTSEQKKQEIGCFIQ